MLEKDFVPYELAVKLKELGLEKECLAYYSLEKGFEKAFIYAITPYQLDLLVQAPTFSQAFRWFRENYRLSVVIQDWLDDYGGEIVEWTIGEDRIIYEITNRTDTYEEAEIACLTKLIEIVESNSE